jgi:hypothetical protein
MLLIFQFSLQNGNFRSNIEGLTTTLSAKEEQLKMEQKNAGNIEIIKQQLDTLSNLDKQITGLNTNVGILSVKMIELSQTQQNNKQIKE